MKIIVVKYFTLFFPILFLSSTVGALEGDINTRPVRDPFSYLISNDCMTKNQQLSEQLKQWRLLGAIGQKNRWQSWVTTSNLQWISLKNNEKLPDLDLIVSSITPNFIELSPYPISLAGCNELDNSQLSTIRLNFQE